MSAAPGQASKQAAGGPLPADSSRRRTLCRIVAVFVSPFEFQASTCPSKVLIDLIIFPGVASVKEVSASAEIITMSDSLHAMGCLFSPEMLAPGSQRCQPDEVALA